MITATSLVHHDGATYQPGQEIPGLSDEQAAALVACGAAQASEPEPAEPEPARVARHKGND
jgi:hypothetical protein